MGYVYLCLHTFILSDLLTKSMKFYVQKNNAIFILKEEDKVEDGEERREGKVNKKQVKKKMTAPQRPSEPLLPTRLACPLSRKDPLIVIPESSLRPAGHSPGSRFLSSNTQLQITPLCLLAEG